jgi:hypothetical protein
MGSVTIQEIARAAMRIASMMVTKFGPRNSRTPFALRMERGNKLRDCRDSVGAHEGPRGRQRAERTAQMVRIEAGIGWRESRRRKLICAKMCGEKRNTGVADSVNCKND